MRQSLTKTFDEIYILDLHGSSKPKELAPSGQKNENVFDIQKGVAISLFVKKPGTSKSIFYSEFWGTRLDKYKAAAGTKIDQIKWREVRCFTPYYMFRPLDWTGWDCYQEGPAIADSLSPAGEKSQIFAIDVLGFQSHRDHFAIAFDRSDIETRVKDMVGTLFSDGDISEKYDVKGNRDWNIRDARETLRSVKNVQNKIMRCAYRPFDNPYCFFGTEFMDYPRRELLDHVAGRDNICLVVSRQIGTSDWRHAFVASGPANDCLISDQSSEANYVFPLWRFNNANVDRGENFSLGFRAFVDARYEHHYTPEEIIGYIYAVLYAPSYRIQCAEFLRIDFPRVPFSQRADDFEALSELGWGLLEAHLLRNLPRLGLAQYPAKGDHSIEAVRYSSNDESIWVNKTQYFKPVPEAVWDFRIGGYQVLDKYLKSRKGRNLSLDEINHVALVADSLAFTIEQMAKIDKAYQSAFGQRG
jgi:predicted helicase